jgi:hypothetical protein
LTLSPSERRYRDARWHWHWRWKRFIIALTLHHDGGWFTGVSGFEFGRMSREEGMQLRLGRLLYYAEGRWAVCKIKIRSASDVWIHS